MSDGRLVVRDAVAAMIGRDGCAIVWDLDGTLFDPRPRMLAVVRAFLNDVDVDVDAASAHMTWQETAAALGLDPDAFFEFWRDAYWTPEAFAVDAPLLEPMWCARMTSSLGVHSVVLTGRYDDTLEMTEDQLESCGFAPDRVISKPTAATSTASFKAAALQELRDEGLEIGVFVTDAVSEIVAARSLDPPVPCVLVVAARCVTPSADDDVPVWCLADGSAGLDVALPAGLPLPPSMVHELAAALGVDVAGIDVTRPLIEMEHLRSALPGVDDVIDGARRAVTEALLNDHENATRRHRGNLEPRYAPGSVVSLPLLEVDRGDAVVERSRTFSTEAFTSAFFVDDGGLLLPVHPQGRAPIGDRSLLGRATASCRSLRTVIGGTAAIVKCDARGVVLDRYPRSLSVDDAVTAVRTSDALAAIGGLCFFPEVVALGEVSSDTACVVRAARPFPLPDDDGAWSVPAFCLWARTSAFGGGPPLVARFVARLGVDVVLERLLRPLIASLVRLSIDLGCAFSGHGQNVHVELGRDGLPTGRAILADMDDIWPDPSIADALGLPFVVDDAYRRRHAQTSESDIGGAFQDHFIWRLLHPLLQACEPLRPGANALLSEEVNQRRELVMRFAEGPLRWFAETW
ncbi:MAG: hypothetical protein Q8O67_17710 [Deltaproteobacteria bacterium]|nr:hypothetical protein [Deltaproteobacteria bacterium]